MRALPALDKLLRKRGLGEPSPCPSLTTGDTVRRRGAGVIVIAEGGEIRREGTENEEGGSICFVSCPTYLPGNRQAASCFTKKSNQLRGI